MTEATPAPPTDTIGYEMSRFNALRHGVLSRHTVLPWEDHNEYCRLLDALVAEHRPQGPTEEHLVGDGRHPLAQATSKARRGCGMPPGPQKCGLTGSTDH